MNIGMQIGASPEAISEARQGILDILASGAEQETLRAALSAFIGVCSVNNANINGARIQGDTTHHHTHYATPEPEPEPEQEVYDHE